MKRVRKSFIMITAMLMLIFGSAFGVEAAKGINLTLSSVTENSVTVKWNAVTGASSYILAYAEDSDNSAVKSVTLNSKVTSYKIALQKDTFYYVAVGARDAAGKTIAYSDSIPAAAAPGKVTGAEVVSWNKSGTGASFTINNNPAKNTWGGLEYRFLSSKGKIVKSGTVMAFPFTVSSLTSKQIYKLSVREYVSLNGKKFYGPWYTKWIVPEPKLKKAKLASNTRIKVSWRKVKGATKYIVYGSTNPSKGFKKIKTVSKKKSSYIVSKVNKKRLKMYQNYYFKVVACKGKIKSKSTSYEGGYIYYK